MNCVRCNFDDEFITDYEANGTEFVFCGNCGERVTAGQQIDALDMLGMKVSTSGELYAYGTDCRKGTCD